MHSETKTHADFSPDELERLHRDDRRATAVVSGLMTAIFFVGLLLYAAIAVLVGV